MVAASGIAMARLSHMAARSKRNRPKTVINGRPSSNATERNRLQVQRNATERNRLQVQRNATDGKDSLVMDARAHPHVQRRTERTRCYKWYAHPKSEDDKGQRHGNDEQQNGQRTMLFGRRMYAWELQADYDASRSNSSNACGRFRSVKGAHDGAGRLVGQPVRQWLPVGGATTELHCNTFGGRARRPSVTSQPWLSSSHGVAVDEW